MEGSKEEGLKKMAGRRCYKSSREEEGLRIEKDRIGIIKEARTLGCIATEEEDIAAVESQLTFLLFSPTIKGADEGEVSALTCTQRFSSHQWVP